MLERFANVVYYFFVLLSVLAAILGIYSNINDYINIHKVIYVYMAIASVFGSLFIFIIGWSIRYIITGKKSIT